MGYPYITSDDFPFLKKQPYGGSVAPNAAGSFQLGVAHESNHVELLARKQGMP